MINYGKEFELRIKKDVLKSVENCSIDRIYDTVSGYYGVNNVCDFIMYCYPNIYYLEAKTHKGASLPIRNITQYSKLKEKVDIPGVRAGILLWLYEKDIGVIYIPISTITKLKENGEKSFGIRHLDKKEEYPYLPLPSKKKKVFYEVDYSLLKTLEEGM